MKRTFLCFVHFFAVSVCQQDLQDIFLVCENRRLIFQTFMSTLAESKIQCAANCLSEGMCRSAVYFGDKNVCELSQEGQNGRECDKFPPEDKATLLTKINPCKNNQNYTGDSCICEPQLSGPHCEAGPRDCSGHSFVGWLNIYPEDGIGKIRAFCYFGRLYAFAATSGGFTTNYLNSTWSAYKYGFGSIVPDGMGYWVADGAYWIGNAHVHRITSGTLSYKLEYFFSLYRRGYYVNFKVANEIDNYRVDYGSYAPVNVDESQKTGRPFSTIDKNDVQCAMRVNTGFWFDKGCTLKPPLFGTFKSDGTEISYTRFWASLIRIS